MDSVRLEQEHQRAQALFEEAQRDLQAKVGVLPRPEYVALSRAVDQTWVTVQRTRAALDKHMREHSCRTAAA